MNKLCINIIIISINLAIILNGNASIPPSLPTVATNNTQATNSIIHLGASDDNKLTYKNTFYSSSKIDLEAIIYVDQNDIGKNAAIYVIVEIVGVGTFQLTNSGIFEKWDNTNNSLRTKAIIKTLERVEAIPIVQQFTAKETFFSGLIYNVYISYAVDNDLSNLVYTNEPYTFTIKNDTYLSPPEYFNSQVMESISSQCYPCHSATGAAANSNLVFNANNNYEIIKKYLSDISNSVNEFKLKPLDSTHSNNAQKTENSDFYRRILKFIELYLNDKQSIILSNNESNSLEYYLNNFSSLINSTCNNCHNKSGMAAITGFIFTKEDNIRNFEVIRDYIINKNQGAELLLSKPTGVSHGGGNIFSYKSETYNTLLTLIEKIISEYNLKPINPYQDDSFWHNISFLSNRKTYKKAALLFAGTIPSDAQYQSLDNTGENGLRLKIRQLMQGEYFENFILDSANDQLFTRKYKDTAPFFNIPQFPGGFSRIRQEGGPEVVTLTFSALGEEPLRLFKYVITNELPYTEVLTADYTMVNPYSSIAYGNNITFNDNNDWNEWRKGKLLNYVRFTKEHEEIPTTIPHAGVLNTLAFLARYPSTATNRNRARAKKVFKLFLGIDIEKLAHRITDPDALKDTDNPTMNNPNCSICHQIMDPVAGAFQNYGFKGHYRESLGGQDSLPDKYRTQPGSPYQPGDIWYRDMRKPGFGDLLAPSADNSLQWLAQQLINDPRFASGAVKFWFPAVFGRQPLMPPESPSEKNFQPQLIAYNIENSFIERWAKRFREGTTDYGSFNVKDLLVDMVTSKLFRADYYNGELSSEHQTELAHLGYQHLLTPKQLNSKFEALTGYKWQSLSKDKKSSKYLLDQYHMLYGDIDSDGNITRATEITTLMRTVVERMSYETACGVTLLDFSKQQSKRYLFPFVTKNDTPDTESGKIAIRQNLQYLHSHLLDEELNIDHPLIDLSFKLYLQTWQDRTDKNRFKSFFISTDEYCILDKELFPEHYSISQDTKQTIHSWISMMIYFLSDYKFLYR